MYQNMTIIPLMATHGATEDVCVIIYDVTDVANNKLQLRELNAELETLSQTDSLTGLYNRGYWEEQLKMEFNRFHRTRVWSSLVMFDIDHFKKVNDTYGHNVGDEVLRMVAECLQKTARTTDIVGRYGGEEFAAILINTDVSQSRYFGERLRKRIEEQVVHHSGQEISVTISLGIAQPNVDMLTHENWIQLSDQALYKSKENGRNQLTVC